MKYGISFAPCTGFGDEGRSCTLTNEDGAFVGIGYGATDEEAVCEALMDSGLTFNVAFDKVGETINNAVFIDRK